MLKTFFPSYLPGFRRDIQEVVAWSEKRFGALAADRYGLLIRQALRDVLEGPTRPGAKARPDLAPHAYVYHLMFSRERAAGERVKAPRHFVLYRHIDEKSSLPACSMTVATLSGISGQRFKTSRCGN